MIRADELSFTNPLTNTSRNATETLSELQPSNTFTLHPGLPKPNPGLELTNTFGVIDE